MQGHGTHEQKYRLARALARCWGRRRLIGAVILASVVMGIAYYVVTDRAFTATCTYAPARCLSGPFTSAVRSRGPASLAIADAAGEPPHRLVHALGLRSVREGVCERLALRDAYEVGTLARAAEALRMRTTVRLSDGGFIEVAVQDSDPVLAARIANAHGPEVNALVRRATTSRAGRERAFLEDRLSRARVDLAAAEKALADFRSAARTVDAAASARLDVATYAGLKARELEMEAKLEALRTFQAGPSTEVAGIAARLAALRDRLAELEDGDERDTLSGRSLGAAPATVMKERRLARESSARRRTAEFLATRLEHARLVETATLPVLYTVEPAVPPPAPSSMGVATSMTAFAAVGLLVGMAAVNVLDQYRCAQVRARPDLVPVSFAHPRGHVGPPAPQPLSRRGSRRLARRTHG